MTPKTIGRNGAYEITSVIGRGGFATVYRAYHKALDRYVAIKVLRPEVIEPEGALRRFQIEARASARLAGHPNIVTVFDYGEDDGSPYLILQLVDGTTLEQRLKQPIHAAEVERIITSVASALDYAHARQLVHRDLKPSNVLLDSDGTAVLSDFGIAKLLDSTSSLTVNLLGTPEYMSPEQIRGGDIDARSDIYALGIMTYRIFAGRTPFRGPAMAILHQHVNEPVPPMASEGRTIPPGVEAVVMRALSKDAADRQATAGQFAAELSQALRPTIAIEQARAALAAGDFDRTESLVAALHREHPSFPDIVPIERELAWRRARQANRAQIVALVNAGRWQNALDEIERLGLRRDADGSVVELIGMAERGLADERARQEAAQQEAARQEAARQEGARQEAARRAREDESRRAREEAERRQREEAEQRAREDAQRRAWEEEAQRLRDAAAAEQAQRAREEEARRDRDEAERQARVVAERRQREDAERRARQEAERRARAEQAAAVAASQAVEPPGPQTVVDSGAVRPTSMPVPDSARGRRFPIWIVVVVAVAVIGAVVAVPMLYSSGETTPTPTSAPIVQAPTVTAPPAVPTATVPAPALTAPPKPTTAPAQVTVAPKPSAPPAQPTPAQTTAPTTAPPTVAPPAVTPVPTAVAALPTRITSRDDAAMLLVPAGEFIMGSDADPSASPQFKTTLPAYYVDQTEVTNDRFLAFVTQTGYQPRGDWRRYFDRGTFNAAFQDADRGQHPVVNVTWDDAAQYCQWAGKRLPTEAEWEKAARGTDGRRWPWGNDVHPEYANWDTHDETGPDPDTMRGGKFPNGASPYGQLDMVGNAREWTASARRSYPLDPTVDDGAGASDRVTRGGSWVSLASEVEVTDRLVEPPGTTTKELGFRCAVSADRAVGR